MRQGALRGRCPSQNRKEFQMDINQLNAIRQTIELAIKQEQETAHLEGQLRDNLDQLHQAISLPICNSVASLLGFVVRYIEHVPDFLEAMSNMSYEAGIDAETQAVIDIALGFFLNPPDTLSDQSGLAALMDEAYLSHRLMEEVNDRFIGRCGILLMPMDMTRSNLIVHHLIGEPFSNHLDAMVQFSVDKLMNQQQLFDNPLFLDYVELHKARGWTSELERWPCLAKDLAIGLNFGIAEGVEHGYLARASTLH